MGAKGCRTAGIGCLECKPPLIDKVVEEISGIRSARRNSKRIPNWCATSSPKAPRRPATPRAQTLDEVRRAMHLRPDYGRAEHDETQT